MSNIDKIISSNNNVFDPTKIFETFAYKNVRRANDLEKSNHKIFYGQKDGVECVLKFVDIDDDILVNRKLLAKEEYCYRNLPKEYLLDLVEINYDYKFLVTKRLSLSELNINKELIDEVIAWRLEKLIKIKAYGLSEVSWEHYMKMFKFLIVLGDMGIVDDPQKIIDIFEKNRNLIMNCTNGFSHGDFSLRNIKKHGQRLLMYDFEYACRDNPMFDLATFYSEINNNQENKEHFVEKASDYLLFNKKVFDLMKIRRAVLLLYAFRKRERSSMVMEKYLMVFKEAVNDLLLGYSDAK
jgi:thiamine kinase-like enzyme